MQGAEAAVHRGAPFMITRQKCMSQNTAQYLSARYGVGLKQLGKLLVELIQLGRNGVLTVRLIGIVGVKFLMVIFRRIKLRQRLEGCHYGILKCFCFVELLDERSRLLSLLVVGVENRRAVLRTGVVTLAIKGRRIMRGEKNRHEIAE